MKLYLSAPEFDLWHGDCIEVMRELSDCSVDAVVTDPPYELGFMGKGWDNSGIAYRVEVWTEALRVLKPGGHLLAFGGTRTGSPARLRTRDLRCGTRLRGCTAAGSRSRWTCPRRLTG